MIFDKNTQFNNNELAKHKLLDFIGVNNNVNFADKLLTKVNESLKLEGNMELIRAELFDIYKNEAVYMKKYVDITLWTDFEGLNHD